ncbi:Uncharacterized protein Adt_31026 [Abeliophyllum distichum]|uniref:Uncharacterized protein n=1 Tax=Abeliophyllum distichum TaxID=126358 RepID=A0ABD1RCX8_9LAMI
MTKFCRRYDEMEAIFGNDTAAGDRAVSGFDNFSPIQVDGSVNEVDTPNEDTDPKLILSLESSKTIAQAIQIQATPDTLNHVNWQLITEKLEAMNLDLVDIMKVFRSDSDLAKVFMSLTNTIIMRALVFEQLGRDLPPLP